MPFSGIDTALAPNGRFLLVCGGGPVLAVVDVEQRAEIHTYLLDSDCGAVDVCDDGSVLVASTEAGWVRRLFMGPAGQIEHAQLSGYEEDAVDRDDFEALALQQSP